MNFGKILRAPFWRTSTGDWFCIKQSKMQRKISIKYIEGEYQLNFYERKKSDESFWKHLRKIKSFFLLLVPPGL